MLEKDVLLAKIYNIKNCLDSIDKVTKGDVESVNDMFVEDVVVLNLQRACQACIDMAKVVISLKSLGLPNSYKMSFSLLSKNNLISNESSVNMQNMVGFRNIAVHDYQDIDKDILKSVLTKNLKDFAQFYTELMSNI